VKDFDLATNTIMPVGKGNIDFKPAFENAELAGIQSPLFKPLFWVRENQTVMLK